MDGCSPPFLLCLLIRRWVREGELFKRMGGIEDCFFSKLQRLNSKRNGASRLWMSSFLGGHTWLERLWLWRIFVCLPLLWICTRICWMPTQRNPLSTRIGGLIPFLINPKSKRHLRSTATSFLIALHPSSLTLPSSRKLLVIIVGSKLSVGLKYR